MDKDSLEWVKKLLEQSMRKFTSELLQGLPNCLIPLYYYYEKFQNMRSKNLM